MENMYSCDDFKFYTKRNKLVLPPPGGLRLYLTHQTEPLFPCDPEKRGVFNG